ncbi:MAG: PsiF repeat family protein [Planctomycetes bacterium]|nr:PsiF repeat family protein [Planctomycetota bacterium]
MTQPLKTPSPNRTASLVTTLLALLIGGALTIAQPKAPAFAQSTDAAKSNSDAAKSKKSKAKKDDKADSADASGTKEKKKLTPQQQRMKDCAAKWKDEKKAKNVKGREAYRKFLSTCLKKD